MLIKEAGMTKRELTEKLKEKVQTLSATDAELIISIIFDSMAEALASGERIEIRGFGSFEVRERNARQGRNPKSGQKVKVEAKKVPFFKVGKELRQRVDK
jgi:integration host factor beta subunit